jgi:hypothetical protein
MAREQVSVLVHNDKAATCPACDLQEREQSLNVSGAEVGNDKLPVRLFDRAEALLENLLLSGRRRPFYVGPLTQECNRG